MEKEKKKEVDNKIDNLLSEIQDRNTTNEFQDIMKKRKANIFFIVTFIIAIALIIAAVIFIFNPKESEKDNTGFLQHNRSPLFVQNQDLSPSSDSSFALKTSRS
jgi:hypothetical protein